MSSPSLSAQPISSTPTSANALSSAVLESQRDFLGRLDMSGIDASGAVPALETKPAMAHSKLFEKCIKVSSLKGQSHIMDVSALNDAKSIRELVFKKFMLPAEERGAYAMYGLDVTGKLDISHPLDDVTLLDICKSPNVHLKAHLILKKTPEAELAEETSINAAIHYPLSSNSAQKNIGKKPSHLALPAKDIISRQGSQAQLKSADVLRDGASKPITFAPGPSSAPIGSSPKLPISSSPSHYQQYRLPHERQSESISSAQPRNASQPISNRSSSVPKSQRRPYKKLPSVRQHMEPAGIDSLHPRQSSMVAFQRRANTTSSVKKRGDKISAFFGERPPSELICEHLEIFFPNLADVPAPVDADQSFSSEISADASHAAPKQEYQQQTVESFSSSIGASGTSVASSKKGKTPNRQYSLLHYLHQHHQQRKVLRQLQQQIKRPSEQLGSVESTEEDRKSAWLDVQGGSEAVSDEDGPGTAMNSGSLNQTMLRREQSGRRAPELPAHMEEDEGGSSFNMDTLKAKKAATSEDERESSGLRLQGPVMRDRKLSRSATTNTMDESMKEQWRDRISMLGSSGGLFVTTEDLGWSKEEKVAARRRSTMRRSGLPQRDRRDQLSESVSSNYPIEGAGVARETSERLKRESSTLTGLGVAALDLSISTSSATSTASSLSALAPSQNDMDDLSSPSSPLDLDVEALVEALEQRRDSLPLDPNLLASSIISATSMDDAIVAGRKRLDSTKSIYSVHNDSVQVSETKSGKVTLTVSTDIGSIQHPKIGSLQEQDSGDYLDTDRDSNTSRMLNSHRFSWKGYVPLPPPLSPLTSPPDDLLTPMPKESEQQSQSSGDLFRRRTVSRESEWARSLRRISSTRSQKRTSGISPKKHQSLRKRALSTASAVSVVSNLSFGSGTSSIAVETGHDADRKSKLDIPVDVHSIGASDASTRGSDFEGEEEEAGQTIIAFKKSSTTHESTLEDDGTRVNVSSELDTVDLSLTSSQKWVGPSFTPDDEAPTHIDWVKGHLIGKGSFGCVYFGVNLNTKDVMAVKQVEIMPLPLKRQADTDSSKRRQKMVDALRMEISLLRELNQQNIVQYLGFDVEGNTISVFLEYVDGGSVASMLSRYGCFEKGLVQSISRQILSGMDYLHERSIIHRDIKGANILVSSKGVAKISDFGISKKNEYNMAYRYNSRMSLQGSVFWMAPEVIKGKGYSAKVDIWSLGCVTLEMCTGNHPWKQFDEMQTMWKLGKENTPPIPDSLDDDVRDFILQCFTIEPELRPTAAELALCNLMDIDPRDFDFVSWREAAEEAHMDSDDDDDFSESDQDDEIDDDDDEEEDEEEDDEGTYHAPMSNFGSIKIPVPDFLGDQQR
ncbi:ATP binding [Chytridiales sp. JEL 0842]|nr:ATP binding [Chytridiales sp. JEL 0842]